MSNEVDVQQFKRVVPRRVRLIFKSGHVETINIRDDVDVTWTMRDIDGKMTDLDIPRVQGYQGAYINVYEIAALFVLDKEEI